MKRSTISRIEKIESQTGTYELKITLTRKVVAVDKKTGKRYVSHGYRKKLWTDEPEEYLPREYFTDEDPTHEN